jgi:hypothetical protein
MSAAPGRGRSRGRRVLVWTAGLFCLLQLLCGWALDHVWPQLRFPELYTNLAQVEGQSTAPTVVCLGSSRFGTFLNGQEMTRCLRRLSGDRRAWVFNASVPWGDPLASEKILQEMLERGVRPRYALIEMCPPTVAARNPWPGHFMQRQLQWSDLPVHVVDLAQQGQLVRTVQFRLLPLYAYRERICQQAAQVCAHWCAMQEGRPDSASTGLPPSSETDDAPAAALDWDKVIPRAPLHGEQQQTSQRDVGYLIRDLRQYRPGGTQVAALERLLRLCRVNGIEPILVGVPVTSTFRACVKPDMEASYRAFLTRFCEQNACPFVDYYAALPDNLFVDYHHGSSEGGQVFSHRLTVEVLAPRVQNRRPS